MRILSPEEKNKIFVAKASLGRVNYLCKQIANLNTTDENNKEYKKLLYELIELCQNGYLGLGVGIEERDAIDAACAFLSKLYHPLIRSITNYFIKTHKNIDSLQVESYATDIFNRLITGNTPWVIDHYKNKNPSTDTRAELADIQIKKHYENYNNTFEAMRKMFVHPKDKQIIEDLIQDGLQEFPEAVNTQPLEFHMWVYFLIKNLAEKWEKGTDKQDQERARSIKYVLKSPERIAEFIVRDMAYYRKKYDEYKKDLLKNQRFNPKIKSKKENLSYEGYVHFDSYIRKYLMWELKSLFKRNDIKPIKNIHFNEQIHSVRDDSQRIYFPTVDKSTLRQVSKKFTKKQRKVIKLMLKGLKKDQIAKELGVTENAIFRILQRINVRNINASNSL